MRRARLVCMRAASGALLPAAAFAVHQLRYMLAYGSGSDVALQRSGHAYLHSVAPWLVMVLALAAGSFLRAMGRALTHQTSPKRYTLSFFALWVACAGALVMVFAGQELLEGLFATGHPAGIAGIFGYGGWWAVPAAACIGLVLAAVFHGARWIVTEIARRAARPPADRRLGDPLPRPGRLLTLTPAPLLAGWSTRGPPA